MTMISFLSGTRDIFIFIVETGAFKSTLESRLLENI